MEIIPADGVEQAKVGESREDVKRRIGRPTPLVDDKVTGRPPTGLADFARRAWPAREGK